MFARFLFKSSSSVFRSSIHKVSTRNIAVKPNGKSAHIENSSVNVQWSDGKSGRFHGIWLRDHCHCPQCYHPETKQRLVNTVEIPINIRPASVKVLPERDSLEVVWDTKDKHRTEFELAWLRHHSYDPKLIKDTGVAAKEKKILWDAESFHKELPVTEYEEVMQSDEGLAKWLRNIDIYGLAFVDNAPISKEETERLARRICFVRESHFGGFWDFTANMAHADTAYTTLPLRAHTDTTYFTDSVGLQMFHLLEFNGKGGESLFVDGFNVAEQLRRYAPEAYKTLSTVLIPTHCAGDKETFILPTPRARPILNIDPITKTLFQVRYNNDDRSPLSPALSPSITPEQIEAFYAALKEWSSLLQKRSNEFWIPLKPGRVAIFDNWRVLHGRSSFSGHRRLIGTYLNWDDYRSRVRTVAGEGGPGGFERWQL